jgi:hypothetical protein
MNIKKCDSSIALSSKINCNNLDKNYKNWIFSSTKFLEKPIIFMGKLIIISSCTKNLIFFGFHGFPSTLLWVISCVIFLLVILHILVLLQHS